MKILLLIIFSLLSFARAQTQDIIVTINNQFLEVKIISIGKEYTFFKEPESKGTTSIDNKFIKGFRWNSIPESRISELGNISRPEISGSVMHATQPSDLSIATGYTGLGLGLTACYKIAKQISSLNSFSISSSNSRGDEGVRASTLFYGSVICLFVSAISKKNVKYWKEQKPIIDLGDYNRRLLDKKYALETYYLSAANTGIGIQLNF